MKSDSKDEGMGPILPREPVAYTTETELIHLLRDDIAMMYKRPLRHRCIALYAVPLTIEENPE